jgi:hypothetical protein
MPLRDTLRRLGEKQNSDSPFDRERAIQEWREAVVRLYDQIREFLKDFLDEGTITLRGITLVQLSEESLGQYPISMMSLVAGPAVIEIKPVGRMIVGATGRVDLYRQGRGSANERVMVLRTSNPSNKPDTWELNIPPRDRSFEVMGLRNLQASQERETLSFDKPNLELAIDRLLQ